jgi:membrane-associated protein
MDDDNSVSRTDADQLGDTPIHVVHVLHNEKSEDSAEGPVLEWKVFANRGDIVRVVTRRIFAISRIEAYDAGQPLTIGRVARPDVEHHATVLFEGRPENTGIVFLRAPPRAHRTIGATQCRLFSFEHERNTNAVKFPSNSRISSGPEPAGDGRCADVVCLSALAACQSWVLLSALLIPALVGRHPVLLEAVNGSAIAVAVVGSFVRAGHAHVAIAVLASLPLWLLVDLVSWWAGRRFGTSVADRLLRRRLISRTSLARCENLVDRNRAAALAFAPLIPVPTALVFATCGWRRTPVSLVVAAESAGNLSRNAVYAAIGYGAGLGGARLAREVSHVAGLSTGVVIGLVFIGTVTRRLWRRRSPGS